MSIILNNDHCHTISLNTYMYPPSGNISIDYAKKLIKERMNLLQVLNNVNGDFKAIKGNPNYFTYLKYRLSNAFSDFGDNFFKVLIKEYNPKDADQKDARERDYLSHFLLRLFYCQREELREWFVKKETELFRLRLMDSSNRHNILSISEANNMSRLLNFELVSFDKLIFNQKLANSFTFHEFDFKSVYFYKILFEDALTLVKNRQVFISDGYAYVPSLYLYEVFLQMFRTRLLTCLIQLNERITYLNQSHLISYISSLHEKMKSPCYNVAFDSITDIEDIHTLSKYFPPCMLNIYSSLHRNHHIRHYSRVYYGQFLKNIGLKLEHALEYFRKEFLQKMDSRRFNREYAPNIRYNYISSGKMNRSAFGCSYIIGKNSPGPLDIHGCPFVHMDKNSLKLLLKRDGVSEYQLNKIINLSVSPQSACSKYFITVYSDKILSEEGIFHPNQYYNLARCNGK